MKLFGVLLLVIASVLVGAGPVGTKIDENEVDRSGPMSANMNNYVDIIMIQIGPWLNQNFVPIDLPDFIEGFEHRPIIITYHGEIELTNGVFHSIQSVVRSGTAMMHYDRKVLRVVLGANIRQLGFTYDYSAHIMDLGPSGWVDVDIATMTFQFEFAIDLSNFFIYLEHFQLTNIGSNLYTGSFQTLHGTYEQLGYKIKESFNCNLNIRFRGNILVDWLSNIFVGIITTIFNNTITNIVSNSMHDFIQATLDEMNARVQAQGRALTEHELANLVHQLKTMF